MARGCFEQLLLLLLPRLSWSNRTSISPAASSSASLGLGSFALTLHCLTVLQLSLPSVAQFGCVLMAAR